MTRDVLEPSLDLLTQEHVLVQAWKKTASHIRYHNWFSDTLELDRAAVNLPSFLADLAEQMKTPDQWCNDPLRIVPAPKSQQWLVTPDLKRWEPKDADKTAGQLRPLAHVSLKDQVAATAVMLCLADRIETIQGDPRDSTLEPENRRRVISYGNRLFCDGDAKGKNLRHHWGSGKLYRAYYQDYQSFLSRAEAVAEAVSTTDSRRIVIVYSDLRQFYDRVRPELLAQKIHAIKSRSDDPQFYTLFSRLLNWEWDKRDSAEVESYAEHANLSGFSRIALPQGLVSAGFFANAVLLDFDQGLREALVREIEPGVCLEDACRYVDDLRIVLTVETAKTLPEIEQLVIEWLQKLLDRHADGLLPNKNKTTAVAFRGGERPLVRQSRKMARIQSAVSGGFDAIAGGEILDAVYGLIRSQQRYSEERAENHDWSWLPVPDVRDATVERFAAGRFRSTYRSLRPLLADREHAPAVDREDVRESAAGRSGVARTQAELDDEARAFAFGLIESWVEDPSNVRLLRVGLDLWPAADVLRSVLELLRPFTKKNSRGTAPRQVAWYCLSEIFRAGATETGFVEDNESLPERIDIAAYRSLLRKEAVRLMSLSPQALPWYLKQQVLLFLAANDPAPATVLSIGRVPETLQYHKLILFLIGEGGDLKDADFATLAILSRRSFLGMDAAVQLIEKNITARLLEQIAVRDPSFGLEILKSRPDLSEGISPRLRDDLCLAHGDKSDGWVRLSHVVLQGESNGPLRNELALLRFAEKFLSAWLAVQELEVITPSNVFLQRQESADGVLGDYEVKIIPSRVAAAGSMYRPPDWCSAAERWRFQLGYLLRFILSARQDFTRTVRPYHWKERTETYRPAESHWYQRHYGLFNGHSAFGDDWLPISDWTEQLLFALLQWPGCRGSDIFDWARRGIEETLNDIVARHSEISDMQGPSPNMLILPLALPHSLNPSTRRPLRACVVQTVIPGEQEDFKLDDLTLSKPTIRRRHRRHLSAALAAIERMLDLRETHKEHEGRLDWLILPELSVHPRDVQTHLVPFARAHKTIILAGLTYESLFTGQPLVNSALWIIPVWSSAHGWQIITRRQGKEHLAPLEEKFNASGPVVQGFRPAQWLVGYQWSGSKKDRPIWLTGSVCYDATDLRLAADLRHHSDVFAIPALNRDVNTFDQMALALHYHMFQMVIVANNGLYGGSNAYVPYKESYQRQVFHLHGQPQASVAFLEIEVDDISTFLERKAKAKASASNWKYPPAGL